jgi:hypothetical protein
MPCPYTLLPDVFSVFFGLTPPCKDNDPDNRKKTGIRDKARTNDKEKKEKAPFLSCICCIIAIT